MLHRVQNGRVEKKARSQPHKSNTELPPPTAGCTSVAKRNTSGAVLANYDAELKYFYFARRYTRDQVRDAMKAIFKHDAKSSEYTYHLNKPEFKKYVKNEEWQAIAPYYYACEELGKQLVVKINGSYVIEPSVVKKEIGRNILLSQKPRIMQQKDTIIQNSTQNLELGRVQACISSNNAITRQAIPMPILANLPCAQSSKLWGDACEGISQNSGKVLAESHSAGVKNLLFLLSNNLFQNKEVDNFLDEIGLASNKNTASEPVLLQFLQALLSLKTVAVEHALENILPLLILRGEVDLISHLFKIHGVTQVKWYIAFLEISLERSLGYFCRTDSDRKVLFNKYRSNKHIIRQFLAKGIEIHKPFAVTRTEAAVLVDCAVRERLVKFDTMLIRLPPELTWLEVEKCYLEVYGGPVLSSNCCFSLLELLEFGFRKSLHTIAMEAIFRNDFRKASTLLSYSKLNLTKEELELLEYYSHSIDGAETASVWNIVGADNFKQLIGHMEQETGFLMRKSTKFQVSHLYGWIQELLLVSFALGSHGLRDFLLGLLQAEENPTDEMVEFCIWQPALPLIYRYDLPLKWYLHIATTGIWGDPSPNEIAMEWVFKLATTGCTLAEGQYLALVLGKLLNSSIRAINTRFVEVAIQMGADVNAPDSEGNSPLFNALPKLSDLSQNTCKIWKELCLAGAKFSEVDVMTLQNRINWIPKQLVASLIQGNEVDSFRFKGQGCCCFTQGVKMKDVKDGKGLSDSLPELLVEMISYSFRANTKYTAARASKVRELLAAKKGVTQSCPLLIIIDYPKLSWDNTPQVRVLQLLALIGFPDLLQSFFDNCSEEAIAQLSRDYTDSPTPLQLATLSQSLECVKILIRYGANPNEQTLQCYWGLRLLGIPNVEMAQGKTALYYAVERGSLDIATYLVEYGADIHARSYETPWPKYESQSVLERSVELGRLDFVALFLSVDISARDVALEAAIRFRASKMADWIQREWGGKIMGTESALKGNPDMPPEKKRKLVTYPGSQRSLLPMENE